MGRERPTVRISSPLNETETLLQQQLDRVNTPLLGEVYIVLDLQGEAGEEVMSARRRFGYDYLGALPVEITVAGSGGVGSPRERGDPRRLFEALDSITKATPAIRGRFGKPHRFPETDIFVLPLEDPQPVLSLHERIKNCGVAFEPSPFEFFPHCTLTQKPEPTEDEVQAVLAVEIDSQFSAKMLSVYEMEAFPLVKLRYRGYLTG